MANKQNKLSAQKSPYLLQHAANPVNWYPWGNEAFKKAKEENKPVFLSIGYSTCHWCHVMAHESFEDDDVAAMLNESFISIKVDREERPDIDGIYMTVCQMLTGSGGWPLTIIMTPDKKPFFAGTYFPKNSRFGRIGMSELLPRIKELWETRRKDVFKSADEITSALQTSAPGEKFDLNEKIFDDAFAHFFDLYDKENGGFGNAPKFPTPHNLMFLLRYWKRKDNPQALEMVTNTLKNMRAGGIYDQLGYGFHRYSTDKLWLVPHFEKMLYDQALLCMAYTEAYLATGENIFGNTAHEILTYILRDMTSSEGAFFSAEDADSEGEEGKYYVWKEEEIKDITGIEFEFVKNIFDIRPDGNWIEQSAGKTNGTNILHTNPDIRALVGELGIRENILIDKINDAKEKLFKKRNGRIRPLKDDKILTDWNSLMISALAKAYQAYGKKEYLTAAESAVRFIFNKLSDEKGRLLHRYRDGESGLPASLDDYSFLISALIDVYESNFYSEYLNKAIQLNDYLLKHFWDDKYGGFFFAGDENSDLPVRQKEIYDGAVPSGNSVAMLNLLKLSRLTGNEDLEEKAYKIAEAFSKNFSNSPYAFTQALIAIDFALGPSYEIVIAGKNKSEDTELFLNKIRKIFIPNKILILNDGTGIHEIAPFVHDKNMIDGKAALYVCKNYNCTLPVTSPGEVPDLIR